MQIEFSFFIHPMCEQWNGFDHNEMPAKGICIYSGQIEKLHNYLLYFKMENRWFHVNKPEFGIHLNCNLNKKLKRMMIMNEQWTKCEREISILNKLTREIEYAENKLYNICIFYLVQVGCWLSHLCYLSSGFYRPKARILINPLQSPWLKCYRHNLCM